MSLAGGYMVFNIYHHAAADGTSGLLMMGEIMKQYKLLEDGKEVEKKPHKPRGSMEELVEGKAQGDPDEVVKKIVKEKIKRANEWKPMLPFDMDEHEKNKTGKFINKILFRYRRRTHYMG